MAKGNRIKNEFINNIWLNVFYSSVGTYVNVINQELGKLYKPEPLSKYIKIGGGFAFKTAQYKKKGIPVIRISDFNNEKIDLTNCIYYEESDSLSKYELNSGDIIICLTGGTIGKLGIVQENLGKLYLNQRVGRFDVLNKTNFEKEYVYWIARSVQDIIKNLAWGAAIPNVSPKQIEQLEFSIPKIEIQKKILEFLNDLKSNSIQKKEYFNFEIEKHIIDLHNNNISLNTVNQEITHQLDLIKDLRQAFLREAMQGKLVSNETSDGKTGADLLAEIQAEKAQLIKEKKIKKSKPLPPISEDETPFDIPENWTWCRLGDLIHLNSGQDLKPSEYNDNNKGIPYITGASNLDNEKVTINRWTEKPKSLAFAGDLLLTCKGSGVGKMAFLEIPKAHVARQIMSINTINSPLLYIYIILKLSVSDFRSKSKSLIPGIDRDIVLNVLSPLPPLEIQLNIISKINELIQYCDNLESSVKESKQYNEMLLQQVLREALEGKEESKSHLKINKTCDNNDTAILASYIIQELNTPDFGRTKLQKILHLAEYHCRLETPLQYYKKTAGPYSKNLENDIENLLRRNKLYDSKKEELKNSDKSKVNYIPLSGAKQINSFFTTEFKSQKEDIDNLLKKFNDKPMEFCEMISTMYAVWNNRLIKGEIIDNEELKKDFLAWDAQKIKFLDKLDYSIEWIKKEGLEPTGFGKYIDKQ
ncbi:restriction endonuclease subunit S [Chryseobacterium flavum]|uniref:restriction endonuclease subunit S n=1 Tax=Chryseobacterium flavum TaxID=415851 RepID=UPI002FDB0909